jgi:GNAT superfamily N-acetyltransferase
MEIIKSRPDDLRQILEVAQSVGNFNQEEIDTVDELFQGYLTDALKSGYNFISGIDQGQIVGFVCWGPTPLTQGTVDLYWIATEKEHQGKGVARQLFNAVVDAAREIGRWQIVIWTSSKPEYELARRFYVRMGCELASQIRDFYDHGDDLCVFMYRIM